MIHRTLVFDFDGTIADTLGETFRIYNQLATDLGLRAVEPDEIEKLRHLNLKQLVSHLQIPKRRVPALISRGTGMMRSNIASLQPIHGMSEVIIEMRRHAENFGILTSNAPANVDLFLRQHNLRPLFDFISSTSKLTGKAKHLRAIRKTFSLRHEEMLYVGDELRDIKASKKAGVPVAAVTWGFNSRESLAAENPDYLIDHPQDFLRLLFSR